MLDFRFLGANGSVQEEGSLNTSLMFSDGGTSVLVDVSSDIFRAVEANVRALFITHNHIDHMYGLPSLIHQMWLCGRTDRLDIVCPSSLVGMVEDLMGVFSIRSKKNMFPIDVIPASSHVYGVMSFETFRTDHTDDSFGIVVSTSDRKIVYTSDSRPIIEPQVGWEKADVLIHETSGLCENEEILVKKGHSSAMDAAMLAVRISAGKLVMCHLPKGSEMKARILDEARKVFANASLATDYMNHEDCCH